MGTKDIILEETFDAGLKYSLYSNFKNWADAFLELADNAVSNRIPKKLLTVEIFTSPKRLRIVNRGGSGMDIDKLREFLQWGKIKSRSSYDIGAYSQGGKAAMGYLGRTMTVNASPNGEKIAYQIDDQDLHDFNKLKKYRALEMPTDKLAGYVEIEVDRLKRNIKGDELESLISTTYRPLIESKQIKFSHNLKEIKTEAFPLDLEFDRQPFFFDVRKGSEHHKSVTGWIGRLTPRSGTKGGFRCYQKGRLICEREFFGHPDANYKQTLNFLFGEVHLNHVPATTNKTDFDRDSDEWQEVQEKMYQILEPHIRDLLGREIQEPTDEEKDRVKKAKEIVNELLKLRKIELESRSFGELEAFGQKQSEQKNQSPHPRPEPKRKNSPATPPPPDASGKRKRVREFMDWTLRPMQETVRSIVEEQDGKKLLVINNLFPGYIVAKGHQNYLIETAALQLAKPEKDEKLTPDEYLEKFDELYAFFCTYLNDAKEKLQTKKAETGTI